MGIRLHRAIGYGILLDNNNDDVSLFTHNPLEDSDFYYESFDFKTWAQTRLDELKALNQYEIGTVTYKLCLQNDELPTDVSDFISIIGDIDEPPMGLLVSFPGAVNWYRYDNPIDYAFCDSKLTMEASMNPLDYSLYPYPMFDNTGFLKGEKNDRYEMSAFILKAGLSEELLAKGLIRYHVPLVIKDALTELRLFKNPEDIHLLRPYRAEWWS